jgi:MFS family permease
VASCWRSQVTRTCSWPCRSLDGISAAVLAVMVPLIIADVTRGTGHFNLAQGTVGTAVGIGASFSTLLAGYTYDHFGLVPAFLSLAGLAGTGFIAVLAFMPETGALPGESNEFRRGALFQNPSRVHQRR